jgi:1-acyl-sn-glycerol-3-phosphate acyltransferase
MIAANKQSLFNAWFAGHARARIQRTFERMSVSGLERARRISAEAPLLVVSNHTSWWDPLVILHASQHLLAADGHALMDAKNLRRLPFFALVGAFGVDLESPMDGMVAMKYAGRLLDRPGRLVWVFPQGMERPTTERPLGFRAGAAAIARVAHRAVTVPAALRYEFAGTERPVLYLSFGEPLAAARDLEVGRVAQEAAVEAELARVERAVRGAVELGFTDVFGGERTPGAGLAEKALALLTARATRARR